MSKQRSLRKARLSFVDDEEDAEDANASVAVPPASVKANQQQKLKEKRAENKLSLLSFEEGEDEGGVVRRKGGKTKPALRIPAPAVAMAAAAAPLPLHGSTYTQVSGAGEYTAERMKDLQRGTMRAPDSLKVSGNFKPMEAANAAPLYVSVDRGPGREGPVIPLPPPALPTTAAIDEDVEDFEEGSGISGGAIPDKETIRLARSKRERLRGAHAAPDYVPMGGEGLEFAGTSTTRWPGDGAGETSAGAAAVVLRCSDEEGEPEEAMRLRFGAGGGAHGAAAEIAGGGEAEDEEEAAWAEEQIRKGVRSAHLRGSTAAGVAKLQEQRAVPSGGEAAAIPPSAAFSTAARPSSQAGAATAAADEVVAALQAALQRAQLSQRQAEKNLARTDRSLADCVAGIERMEEEIQNAGDKYVYVQQLRAYVADLCAMLAEKSPLVEELQDELARAREERAAAHARRCADEDAETGAPAEAGVAAAVGVLTRGGSAAEAKSAAAAAADDAERRLAVGSHIPVQLDEYGRDENAHRRAMVADRMQARAAQRAEAAEANTDTDTIASPAGDATTSESEGEIESCRRRETEVLEAATAAFRDASDDFSSLAAVKARLEGWKARYPAQYNDAYMSDSVPALLAPFVRLELLRWAPATPPYSGLDQQQWHGLLFDYGMPPPAADGSRQELRPGDGDIDLLPRLIKALVVPLALAAVQRQWNPRSARQGAAVAAIVEELMVYVPPESGVLVGLVDAVVKRLEDAVAGAKVPAWPPAALALCQRAEAELSRRFNRAVRVLRCVAAFHEVLPPAAVQALAVQELAAPQLLPHVLAAAGDPAALATRAVKVLDALPAAWTKAGLPRGLEALGEAVRAAVRAMEPAAGYADRREAAAPAARALALALQRLGDGAGARRLALMFGVQID